MKLCCPKCNGSGKIDLYPGQQKILSALIKLGRAATREEIHIASGSKCDLTATYQAVARLARRKLVRQVGSKRPAVYRVG